MQMVLNKQTLVEQPLLDFGVTCQKVIVAQPIPSLNLMESCCL